MSFRLQKNAGGLRQEGRGTLGGIMLAFKLNFRRNLLALVLGLVWVFGAPDRTQAGAIGWYANLEEASTAAQGANKPMLIDFWASWCGACKVMDEVYADKGVIESLGRLMPVRIDYDKKPALARKYNIAGLPAIVLTDSYGNELFHHTGYISAKLMTEFLRALPGDVSEFNKWNKILAEDKSNFEALENMGKNLRTAGFYLSSNEYYGKALKRNEAKTDPSKRESILDQMGLNFLGVMEGKQAADLFEKCLKEFPASPKSPEWTLNLSRAYAAAQKKDKARKVLEAFMRKHPGAAESEKAKALLASL
jgi:thioredoxin-like negative regulator of GroEL